MLAILSLMMEKRILVTAATLGMLGVVLGAFAAHGLEKILDPVQIESFQTGVRYQFYHVFLLLFLVNSKQITAKVKNTVYKFVLVGVILFSGSIYILNLDAFLFGFNIPLLPVLTPVGGLMLILSWVVIIVNAIKIKGLKQ